METDKPVREYTFELAPSKDKLIELVNARLKEGWIPQGGICIEYPANAVLPMYGQAMIKSS